MSTPAQWQGPATEEGPAPGIEFGSPGSRLVAYLIDGIAMVGLVIMMIFLAVLAGVFGLAILAVIPILIAVLFPLVYFPYFWQKSGQTPGMKMMGIKVVRDRDGGPVTWGSAILRYIGYWINQVVFYIGFIWVFVDKRQRGWHDLIAGTCVIKAPIEEYRPEITRPSYGGHLGDPGDPGRLPD
jgi:uncharacterized RDD family membrane protein YckC